MAPNDPKNVGGGGSGFFASIASSYSSLGSAMSKSVNGLVGYEGLEVINPEGSTEDAAGEANRFLYGEPMTVESTTQALCDLALRFGEGDEESMSRPFGVSLLIAGHDENGPSLYYTDPSGKFWQCNAKAIGSGSEGADSSLQEQFNKDLSLSEAETIAVSILKQAMEEKVTPNNVDIAKVAPEYHLYTLEEVEAVIGRL